MNITSITTNPSALFKASFAEEDVLIEPSWEQNLNSIIERATAQKFSTGSELLKVLEHESNVGFSSNHNHSASVFAKTKSQNYASELLGSLMMSFVWMNAKKTFPKVILSEGLYFFECPDGDIVQVNSNKSAALPASKKYDLFKSEKTSHMNFADLIKHYFEELCANYIKEEKYSSLEKAQSYMISFDPKEMKWYARRGLLLKRLGKFTEALSDLKRFLSFCSYEDAPEAVKTALIELEGLKATDNFNAYSIH